VYKHERPRLEARGVVDDPRHDHPTAPDLAAIAHPETAKLPEKGVTLVDSLAELVAILPGLRAAIERKPSVERLAFRIDEVAESLGMSRRAIERERSAGRFPLPDLHFG
jgi:hypothetical protein